MSHRLFALFAALLLLCVGLSGTARAAVSMAAVTDVAAVTVMHCEHPQPVDSCPLESRPAVESGGLVESADVPPLSFGARAPSFFSGCHLPPRPVLQTGHPTPCLAGLLRPPAPHLR